MMIIILGHLDHHPCVTENLIDDFSCSPDGAVSCINSITAGQLEKYVMLIFN